MALVGGIANTAISVEPPSRAQTAALIHQLHGDQYAARDAALAELVEAGPASLEALLRAAGSSDPELAWRASEVVQIVCRSVSTEAPAIHQELTRLSKVSDKPVATLASKHLQRWPIYRHDYAVAELASLGARVGEIDPQLSMETAAPPVPVIFGGFVPIGGGMIPGVGGPIIAEVEEELVVDEAARPPEKIPLLGGLFKAFGKVAGGIHAADEARAAAIAEVIEAKMSAELKRLEGFEDPKDVEVVEEPPEGAAEIEEEIAVDDVEEIADVAVPLIPEGIALVEEGFELLGGEEVVTTQPSVDPGSILFDKSWRGFDDGLRYLPDLRNVHSATFAHASVTDHALVYVAAMKSLSRLEVRGTNIRGAALQKLKRSRPHLDIVAIGPSVLGVTGSDNGQGVQVQGVIAESGARRAGLDIGDVIHKLNDLPVRSFNDLTLALYDKQPGETVTVGYSRHGKKLTAKVVLTPRSGTTAAPATPSIYSVEPGFRVMPAMGFPLRGGFMIEAD